MANTNISCPKCNDMLEADESLQGKTVSCPSCKTEFIIPSPAVKKVVVKPTTPPSPPLPPTKGMDEKFCESCGMAIKKEAEICPKCGVRQKPSYQNGKNWLVTFLLCWFLGIFGIHRFYTGHTTIGIAQILTLGGCGIWALVDFILIIAGSYTDAQGNPLVKT